MLESKARRRTQATQAAQELGWRAVERELETHRSIVSCLSTALWVNVRQLRPGRAKTSVIVNLFYRRYQWDSEVVSKFSSGCGAPFPQVEPYGRCPYKKIPAWNP